MIFDIALGLMSILSVILCIALTARASVFFAHEVSIAKNLSKKMAMLASIISIFFAGLSLASMAMLLNLLGVWPK